MNPSARKRLVLLVVPFLLLAGLASPTGAGPAAPPNDDVTRATAIADLPFRERVDLAEATRDVNDPKCHGFPRRTVWYSFTPHRTMNLEARITNRGVRQPTTTISAYTGSPGSLHQIGCDRTSNQEAEGARIGVPQAKEGEPVLFMVGIFGDNPGDDATLRVVRARPAPANDRIEGATEISLPFDESVDTFWADGEGDPSNDPDCPQVEDTLWYRFTAPKAMRVAFESIGEGTGQALAYTGSLGSLTQQACGKPETAGGVVHVNLNAGETAYFAAACCADGGRVNVSARRVPLEQAVNDDFGSARPIGRRFSEAVKTTGATSESNDPDCHGAGHTVWYRFVAPFNMIAEASTGGSAYNTVLGVYEVQAGELHEIACRDDELPPDPTEEFGSPSERVRFQAEEGHVYRFMVGTSDEPSILQFRLREHIPVTINPEASQLPDGLAEIHGLLHCTHELEGFGLGTVTQELDSGRMIEGAFNVNRTCRETRRFTARVFPFNGRFRSGELHVELTWVFLSRSSAQYSVTEVVADIQLP